MESSHLHSGSDTAQQAQQLSHCYQQIQRIHRIKAAALQLAAQHVKPTAGTSSTRSSISRGSTASSSSSSSSLSPPPPVHPFQALLSRLEQQDWSTLAGKTTQDLHLSYDAATCIHEAHTATSRSNPSHSTHHLHEHRRLLLQSCSSPASYQLLPGYDDSKKTAPSNDQLRSRHTQRILHALTQALTPPTAPHSRPPYSMPADVEQLITHNRSALSLDEIISTLAASNEHTQQQPQLLLSTHLSDTLTSLLTLSLPSYSGKICADALLCQAAFLSSPATTGTTSATMRAYWAQQLNQRLLRSSSLSKQQKSPSPVGDDIHRSFQTSSLLSTASSDTLLLLAAFSSACASPSSSLSSLFIIHYHPSFCQQLATLISVFQTAPHRLPADHTPTQRYKSDYISCIQQLLKLISPTHEEEALHKLLMNSTHMTEYRHTVLRYIALYAERMQQRYSADNHGQTHTPLLIYSDLLYISELLTQFIQDTGDDSLSIYQRMLHLSTQKLLQCTCMHTQHWLTAQWSTLFGLSPQHKSKHSHLIRRTVPDALPACEASLFPYDFSALYTVPAAEQPSPLLSMFIDLIVPLSTTCRSLHPTLSVCVLPRFVSMLWESWFSWLLQQRTACINACAALQVQHEAAWMKQYIHSDPCNEADTVAAILALSCWSTLQAVLHVFLHVDVYRSVFTQPVQRRGKRKSATVAPAAVVRVKGVKGEVGGEKGVGAASLPAFVGLSLPDCQQLVALVSKKYVQHRGGN